MAFETPAGRKLAVAEADKTVLGFVKRTRTMVQEASGIVSALTAGKADLENAKAASDTARLLGISNATVRKARAGIVAIAAVTYPSIQVSVGRGFRVRKTTNTPERLPGVEVTR